jgi:hypothetical protein
MLFIVSGIKPNKTQKTRFEVGFCVFFVLLAGFWRFFFIANPGLRGDTVV